MSDGAVKAFRFTAIDPSGQRVSRQMRGTSESAIRGALIADGYSPLQVTSATAGLNADLGVLLGAKGGAHLNTRKLTALARQLHQLLRAGIPIPQAVEDLGRASDQASHKQMLLDIAARLQQGQLPSEAFGAYPRTFDGVFIANLEAAQEAGTLEQTLGKMIEIMDRRVHLESRVRAAMSYPVMMGGVIFLMFVGILVWMVPRFEGLFAQFNAELPAPTRAVVAASEWAPLGLAVMAVAVGTFIVWLRRTADDLEVGTRLDRLRFRMPVFGQLMHAMAIYRWSATLAASMEVGVPVDRSLDLAGRASGSRWIARTMGECREAVRVGRPMSGPIMSTPALYPAVGVAGLVSTGERTGSIPDMLRHVAAAQTETIDATLAGVEAKLQAVLMLVMGGVIGGLIIAMYLPVLTLTTTAGSELGL